MSKDYTPEEVVLLGLLGLANGPDGLDPKKYHPLRDISEMCEFSSGQVRRHLDVHKARSVVQSGPHSIQRTYRIDPDQFFTIADNLEYALEIE